MNKAILLGRLTRAPELKQTGTGIAVLSFTLAVDRQYKNAQGERETDFINCVAWRHTAEFIAKYFHKGERMAAVGTIQTRSWEDDSGQKRYATEVVVNETYFADKFTPQANETATAATPKVKQMLEEFMPPADDNTTLPFDL